MCYINIVNNNSSVYTGFCFIQSSLKAGFTFLCRNDFFSYLTDFSYFPLKLFSENCWTRSVLVKNDHFERFQLFFIYFSYFIF